MAPPSKPLQSVLQTVDDVTHGEATDLKTLITAFDDRAFGPVLTLCGVILLTPIGAIPGVPLALFIILASFAIQIIFGRSHPWMPGVLSRLTISQRKIESSRKVLRPVLEKIDPLLRPRWPFAVRPVARKVAALMTLLLGASLIPLGAIPFAAVIPGAIIVTLGLGITARDGLVVTLGLTSGALCFAILLGLVAGSL